MNKIDKLAAILGAVILVVASIGIYFWDISQKTTTKKIDIEYFYDVAGEFSNKPKGIIVSDFSPFYALIATPLAVHYDKSMIQEVVPFYIKNFSSPSRAVTRAIDMSGIQPDLIVGDSKPTLEVSLEIVEDFWKSSDAVLLIQNNQSGYNLGVLATPIASYLSIPVIITDELNNDIEKICKDLGVKKSIVCGDIKGYGDTLKFNDADEIVDASIDLVREKFGEVNYITLTNPIDTYEPEVLDKVVYEYGPETVTTVSTMQMVTTIKKMVFGKPEEVDEFAFTIPKDYKYALVKLEGINLNPEDVDLLGDQVTFKGLVKGSTSHSPSVYDSNGNLLYDRYYTENVFYDMGGTEHTIEVQPGWVVRKKGEVKATVTVEKLSDPMYPMMKGLSAVAPYLTAYHKGIIFGKPGFAFVADDDVFTEKAENCPGAYMPRANEQLVGPSNEHIIKNIHEPLNSLLEKLANITVNNPREIRILREYYKEKPVYIALVGGATVLPQYIYDAVVGYGGTPSDVIYGNIDPTPGWENQQDDVISDYPFVENIVGRITGWDAQDASALVTRTIFYEDIINRLGDWKNKATVQTGCGLDFAKPLVLMKIAEALGTTEHVAAGYEEPIKWPTGCTKFAGDGLQKLALEPMGFDVKRDTNFQAMRTGLSDEAINKLKVANVLNLLLLSRLQLKLTIGEKRVSGGADQEASNFIFINGHGDKPLYTVANVALSGLGLGYGPFLPALLQIVARVTHLGGPGASIGVGLFNVRAVEKMDFGPSFMWFESCLVGAIEDRHPQTCISQAYLHAGMNALIASPTPTSAPGGYLEPYRPYSTILGTIRGYIKAKLDSLRGIYPEHHFGEKIYEDMLHELKFDDSTVGLAFRNAKNKYLPEDADWTIYWTPPLGMRGRGETEGKTFPDNKFTCFQEYCLYGDPAFNPYEPCNLG